MLRRTVRVRSHLERDAVLGDDEVEDALAESRDDGLAVWRSPHPGFADAGPEEDAAPAEIARGLGPQRPETADGVGAMPASLSMRMSTGT